MNQFLSDNLRTRFGPRDPKKDASEVVGALAVLIILGMGFIMFCFVRAFAILKVITK
jgi:hypothetical protein